MHLEVQVALNFFISHLYNKLPRRRVNLFGEELERALKAKFANHWYPDKPMKGSAYRCLKTGNPTDPILQRAATEANVSINDILENLPIDMSVWIDPGEVSYRIGEKGQMKVLWSEVNDTMDDLVADREVTKTFNPDAQIFQPIEAARKSVSPFASRNGLASSPDGSPFGGMLPCKVGGGVVPASVAVALAPPTLMPAPAVQATPWSPHTGPNQPQLMTTAAFAQTKFGSTKLKTSSKRTHRMSPTEFSNYIKQRALQQQQQKAAQAQVGGVFGASNGGGLVSRPRSLSPQDFGPFGGSTAGFSPAAEKYNPFETAIWSSPSPTLEMSPGGTGGGGGANSSGPFDTNRQLLEGLSLGLNAVPYRGQYQHLLVAN